MATSEERGHGTEPPTAGPKFQFTLTHLLAAPVWLALFFASFTWLYFAGAALFVFLSCLAYTVLVSPAENTYPPFRRRYLIWALAWVGLFKCPSDQRGKSKSATATTSYLAIVGPDTAWPEDGSTGFADFADGTSNTLLVVEVVNSGVHWAEPGELDASQMAHAVNPKKGQGICSAHPDGANVLFADGSVQWLGSDTPASWLEALLTIAGGEAVEGP